MTFSGSGFFAVVGVSLCLAWLIAGKNMTEETRGGVVRFRTYLNKYTRIGSLTLLITALAMVGIYHTGFPFTITVSGEPPVILVILVAIALFWNSFYFNELRINREKQEIIYSQGFFFIYSSRKIRFPEVLKILIVAVNSDEREYTLYVETQSDREYLFESRSKAEAEMVADRLRTHLELPVEHLEEEPGSLMDFFKRFKK